ncbi:MAG: ATP-binding protein [Puia sp.]|nr:ATP-binding protein [Puia sp.]
MKAATERSLIIVIILAVISVVAIIAVSVWQSERLQDTADSIRHTNSVLFRTKDVVSAYVQYELSVKNFLVSGDSSLLPLSRQSSDLLYAQLDTLRELTKDNPLQQKRLDTLRRTVDDNRQVLDSSTALLLLGRRQDAGDLIASREGQDFVTRVQSLLGRLQSEENQLLAIRRIANQRVKSRLQEVFMGLIIVVGILIIVVVRKIRADIVRRKEDARRLSLFSQELERQVLSKTADLQASEEKYRTIFYKSPLPKWIYDQETLRFMEVNEAAILHYGYKEHEFLSMTIRDIRPPEDVNDLLDDIKDATRQNGETRHGVWRHLKKNGEPIVVEITAHSIFYNNRKARMVVVNDVTRQKRGEAIMKQLNEDLRKRASELAASNAELERFAYIASHDLQEPLRMVSSFLQLLKKKYKDRLDEKANQYIHFAVDGSERMKGLILDLLEYSRLGFSKENFGEVDLDHVVTEVKQMFAEKIKNAGAHIETRALPVVHADKIQMGQLFQNLISNALKYRGPEKPLIRLEAIEWPEHWLFKVSDNGIGIDPQFFEKIFVIFQRLHTRSEYSGTGIGLAICKKIVERHGGRIWVESEMEKGSTFFFTILK